MEKSWKTNVEKGRGHPVYKYVKFIVMSQCSVGLHRYSMSSLSVLRRRLLRTKSLSEWRTVRGSREHGHLHLPCGDFRRTV